MSSGWSVIAVRYGTLETTRSEVYYRYHSYGEPDGPQVLDYYFWILRRGDETILVDTGFDPERGRGRGRTCLIEPAQAMAVLGVGPETVSRVGLTHLHYDHPGNLDLFPDAELLVAARDLDFWLGPLARRAQFAHAVEAEELGQVLAAVDAGRVRLLEGGEEIAEGVHAILLGGHSPGQLALGIDAVAGWTVLASDALHFYEELERAGPSASSPTWPRCTRPTTRCASCAAPAPTSSPVTTPRSSTATRASRVRRATSRWRSDD